MATIVKTPSGTWKAMIRKSGWPTKTKTFRTKRDAEDWSRRTEDEMVRGVFIQRTPSEKMTIETAMLRYVKEVVPTKKPSTQQREASRVKQLLSYFGGFSLAAVTSETVATYRDLRLEQGKSNNTVRLELALLGHLFTVAIKEWHIGLTYSPVANIRKPSPGAGRNRRISLTEEQLLLETMDAHSNPMLGWITRLAIETSMRQSEILTLKVYQVDLKKRVIRLTDTKNDDARTVPLTKEATLIINKALQNPLRPKDIELIFFGELGKTGKRSPYAFNKTFGDLKAKIGMADLHFHDLRHEAVSRFVEGGLSDQEVASISGHKSMQMLRRYTHLRAEDLVHRLDKLADKQII